MILLAFVPLLYPPIPPLVDIGGHMGRYKVAADVRDSPILQQWFSLPLAADRQSRRRPAGRAAGQADRARAGDQAGRHVDPAADRGGHAVGRARGAQPPAADGRLRAAAGVRPSVHVRLRQFRAVDGAGAARVRAVAAARAAGQVEAARAAVRADQLHRLFRPYLRLGHARAAVLLGRSGAPARPRPELVDGGPARGLSRLGDGAAAAADHRCGAARRPAG